jgi:hypothetical protein
MKCPFPRAGIAASLFAASLFAVALPIAAAHAQQPDDAGICSGPVQHRASSPVVLMRVVAPEARVHFIEDHTPARRECPAEGAACRRKGFVVPGDEVLAAPVRGRFACVSYISPHARRVKAQFPETSGFLPAASLQPVAAAAPKPADWFGTWSRHAEAEIRISEEGSARLRIEGSATWGALDPGRVKRGAVNSGELEGEAAPRGNALAIGEGYADPAQPFKPDHYECQARLRLFGRYLVVEDNGACGGMNVSFTGIYVRLK